MPAMPTSSTANSDTLVLQMQINQLQSRIICIHQTLDVLVGSVNEMMTLLQQNVRLSSDSAPAAPAPSPAPAALLGEEVVVQCGEEPSLIDVDHRRRTAM